MTIEVLCRRGHPLPIGARRQVSDRLVCRQCRADDQRRYRERQGDYGQRRQREWQRRYKLANLEKIRAQRRLRTAVDNGTIQRPSTCEECGSPKPQAAHYDYSRALDVRWLCQPCHMKWDATRKGSTYV